MKLQKKKKKTKCSYGDCLLPGLAEQLEGQRTDETREGSFSHWDTFVTFPPCAASAMQAEPQLQESTEASPLNSVIWARAKVLGAGRAGQDVPA